MLSICHRSDQMHEWKPVPNVAFESDHLSWTYTFITAATANPYMILWGQLPFNFRSKEGAAIVK